MTALDYPIKGDRPLGTGDKDQLGFREVAARIASSLVDHRSDNGLVIGLEGAWGSGKSSLLYLIEDELGKFSEDQQPIIINFRPWLIGNRDALMDSLFGDFTKRLDELAMDAGDLARVSASKAQEAAATLRKFTKFVSRAASVMEVTGEVTGISLLRWLGKGARAAGEMANGEVAPQLFDVKEQLVEALKELNQRFIITIDDVDRLEPAEVMEVLRLIRAVGDFPNVIYLLCYDGDILAHSIKKAAKVKSGAAYLEKIVQLTIMVPQPEPLQLRQWFTDELYLLASTKNEDELARLRSVVDYEGGAQLRTPRSVVRTLDAVRFSWPPLEMVGADLADFVFLQLIKDGNPSLYRWIENYVATAALVSLGTARVSEEESAKELSVLQTIVAENRVDSYEGRYHFADILPGVEASYDDDGAPFEIYQQVAEEDRDDAIRNARLASSDHYSLYFRLAAPIHAITQEEFTYIWQAAAAGTEPTKEMLMLLHGQIAAGSLSKVDMLLDRIKGGAYETLSNNQCENILIALAQTMDEAYRSRPFDEDWVSTLWTRATALIPLLLSQIQDERRSSVLEAMFCGGVAISWLTTVLRRETFSHGRYGDRPRAESEWLMTDNELDQIIQLMLGRFRKMLPEELLGVISPANLLFAWRQCGDEKGPQKLVDECMASDSGLIAILEKFENTVRSSDRGNFKTLRRENLAEFFDYDDVVQRVNSLKEDGELGSRARDLATAIERGARY